MHPVLVRIPTPWGAIPVFSYGATIALGFVLTYFYVCRLAARRGIDDDHITDLYLIRTRPTWTPAQIHARTGLATPEPRRRRA